MSVSDSRAAEKGVDLSSQLEAEVRRRKELELRINEKESEAECAVRLSL